MSRIRGKDTTPEKIVRSLLHRMGYRFRFHVRVPVMISPQRRRGAERDALKERRGVDASLSASNGERAGVRCRTPRAVSVDILLPKHKTAIFVHGCFWHRHKGCKNCTTPTNCREWWLAKLNGNAARDRLRQAALRKLGWRVIVIWECETEDAVHLQRVVDKLNARLLPGRHGRLPTCES
jgi:DNA mismatch endonuclease, patch repair protein